MPARRRRWRSRLIVGAAVVAAVIAVGTVAYARTGSAPGYRTATVTRGPVTATLDLVGTLTPAHSATVGFAQSGTVASVDVSPGQSVTVGQTLARLDLTALQARLTQAQAAEATARQTLVAAENGQLTTSSGGGGAASGGTRSTASTGNTAAISAAQRKVVSAQKGVDAARAAADAELTAATRTCTGPSPSTPPSPTPPSSSENAACLSTERTLLAAQESLAGKESALSAAQSALSQALGTSASAAASPTAGTGVSSVQLAAYQAALDADIAAVTVAQQNLDQGSAVSPLTGTVVSVGIARGQNVAAASSTAVIAISSPDGYEVTTTVPTSAIARTAVGQTASVVADGTSTTLTATVTAIAAAPVGTGYPVTLGLTGSTTGLRQGASASVRLTTGTQHDGIVVPTSAVHTLGTRHVVEVLSGTTVQPTLVTVGIVDPLRTEIVTGLKVGQRVVLADLSSTVTSDSSTTTGGGGALAGRGFGGGAVRRAGG
ncbi:MAG: efflux RND transporter periplasmic adaptor subunit [Blastococcus sp.]